MSVEGVVTDAGEVAVEGGESREVDQKGGRRVNAGSTGSRVGVAYPVSGDRCLACRSRRVQYRAANRRVA